MNVYVTRETLTDALAQHLLRMEVSYQVAAGTRIESLVAKSGCGICRYYHLNDINRVLDTLGEWAGKRLMCVARFQTRAEKFFIYTVVKRAQVSPTNAQVLTLVESLCPRQQFSYEEFGLGSDNS